MKQNNFIIILLNIFTLINKHCNIYKKYQFLILIILQLLILNNKFIKLF